MGMTVTKCGYEQLDSMFAMRREFSNAMGAISGMRLVIPTLKSDVEDITLSTFAERVREGRTPDTDDIRAVDCALSSLDSEREYSRNSESVTNYICRAEATLKDAYEQMLLLVSEAEGAALFGAEEA